MNIVLIGYRGTGKTTVGQLLARRLGLAFIDADVLLAARAGKTIRQIFDEVGEAGFRDLETAVIAELASRDGHVIAAGGGAVLRTQNVTALKQTGKIIWLQAAPETLHARIQADAATAAQRPNLTTHGGGGGIEEITKLLALRTPMYQSAADLTLDVTDLSPEQATAALAARL